MRDAPAGEPATGSSATPVPSDIETQTIGRLRSSFAVYDIVLAGSVLVCRCLAPDMSPGPLPSRLLLDDLALARAGEDAEAVVWEVARTEWITVQNLRLTLRARPSLDGRGAVRARP